MQQRDELWETVDEQKLKDNFHEGIKERLNWKPSGKMTKAQLIEACPAMEQAVKIIKEVQMDNIDKHRQVLQKVEALRQQRVQLLKTARQAALYEEGKHEIVEWQVPTTRNMTHKEAERVVGKIESHIGELQKYQIESN
jgi:hypothetical protein